MGNLILEFYFFFMGFKIIYVGENDVYKKRYFLGWYYIIFKSDGSF